MCSIFALPHRATTSLHCNFNFIFAIALSHVVEYIYRVNKIFMFTTWTKLYDIKTQNQFFRVMVGKYKNYVQLDQCLITLLSMTLRFCNIHPKWFHESLRNNHRSIGNPPPFPSKLVSRSSFHKLLRWWW